MGQDSWDSFISLSKEFPNPYEEEGGCGGRHMYPKVPQRHALASVWSAWLPTFLLLLNSLWT